MPDPFYVLRRMHLFITLNDDELRDVAAHFDLETRAGDEVVFERGAPGREFYVIGSGEVGIWRLKGTFRPTMRMVTRLVAGDYFGEGALVEHRPRNATVKTLTPVELWRLDEDDFRQVLQKYGKRVRPALDVMVQTRRFSRRTEFNWVRPNEILYLITLRHKYYLYRALLFPLPALVVTAVTALGLAISGQMPLFYVMAALAGASGLWVWWSFSDYGNDYYIVTDQRVVDIEKIALIYESRAEAPISTVRSTTTHSTPMGRYLGYGDVIVHTFSGPITFRNVPHPQETADLIQEQLHRAKIASRQADRSELKKSLRQQIGLDQLPPPAPPPPPPKKKLLDPMAGVRALQKHFTFQVRSEGPGGVVTYRKHIYLLTGNILAPSLAILLLVGLIGLRLGGVFQILAPGIFVAFMIFPLLAAAGWWLYQYEDWRNDIYQITPDQIIDVAKKPLGAEIRKAAGLDSITNISYTRPNALAHILNYGTVVIQTGPGGEMRFFDVFDPLGVQQDIFRRREERAAKQAKAAAEARQAEFGQYFSVFYEIMEDERQNRDGAPSAPASGSVGGAPPASPAPSA